MLPGLLTEVKKWQVKQADCDQFNRVGSQVFTFNPDGTLDMDWGEPKYLGKGTWSSGSNGFDGKHNGPDYYSLYFEYSCGSQYGYGVNKGMLFFGYGEPKGHVMQWDKDGQFAGVISIELEKLA